MVLLGPGVVAKAGESVESPLALDIGPAGVAPLVVGLQDLDDLVAVGLVVAYEYTFHCLASFFFLRLS